MIKINTQEYITTKLQNTLEKMILLSPNRLKNLVAIVFGIISSESVIVPKISIKLKDWYSKGTESSKIKRIYRFLSNEFINPELVYYIFACKMIQRYKSRSNKVYIIFDHTTITDKFLILQFSLKVGKRAVPLLFKIFKYKQKDNKSFKHIEKGLIDIYNMLKPYGFEVVLLADRGFRSVDLFKFIDEKLGWKYCIRCNKDTHISIEGNRKVKKLEDIQPFKNKVKHFRNIKLTLKKYQCNISICKDIDADDIWFIAHNLDNNQSIREYKKRFDIEEAFRDIKSGGFNLEDTWTHDLTYARNLYLCVSIAYSWIAILGVSCRKDKKNKILGATKRLKGTIVRIYSIFRTGLKWFERCYNSNKKDYHLKFDFVLYES